MEEGGGGERGQIALRRSLVCVENKLKCCFCSPMKTVDLQVFEIFPSCDRFHVRAKRHLQERKLRQKLNIFLLVSFFSPVFHLDLKRESTIIDQRKAAF